MNEELNKFKREMQELFSIYIKSEGCGCCSNYDDHQDARNAIDKALNIIKKVNNEMVNNQESP